MKIILSVLTRRRMFSLLAVLLALPIAFNLLGAQVVAAQPCNIRTDWPVYVVIGDDTFNKIAQRHGTTAGVLASANCLPNINGIYRGQQLRVPPSPVVVTPVPVPSITVAYNIVIRLQPFDNGFMIWRADSGEISVYVGQVNGKTIKFPSYLYGLLPDNPVMDDPPAGHTRPAFGIGKVWGNFGNIRNSLGWATTPETGYFTTVTQVGNTFSIVLPDGRVVYIDANHNWDVNSSIVPIPDLATPLPGTVVTQTSASYQAFDGGFMVWDAHTGNIIAFYNNSDLLNASYTIYPASQYGNLPDNPVTSPTPLDRIRPTLGIGKVWGNFLEVRNKLGWALKPEQGFLTTFISSSNSKQSQTCFKLPSGGPVTYVHLNTGIGYWLYPGRCQ